MGEDDTMDAVQIAKVLNDYVVDQVGQTFVHKGQPKDGWRWLPIICLKILTANTFFYSIFMEKLQRTTHSKHDKEVLKHLLPWVQLLYRALKRLVKRNSSIQSHEFYFTKEPTYVYRAMLMTPDEIGVLCNLLAVCKKEDAKRRILLPGFVSASVSLRIALEFAKCSQLVNNSQLQKVVFKIRLDHLGTLDASMSAKNPVLRQTCFVLNEKVCFRPGDQEVMFLMPILVLNGYVQRRDLLLDEIDDTVIHVFET